MKRSRASLRAETRAVKALDPVLVEQMWDLFARYYADVSRERFLRDLHAKDHVFLLRDSVDAALRGFSTVQSYGRRIGGRPVMVVYSGDTICDPRFWGQRALHVAFLRYVMRVKLTHPLTPTYWFLISKGYKTYLLLARNFPEHWPRPGRETPPDRYAVLDFLAREKFGDAWQPARGVLHFASAKGRLRPEVAPTGAAELADEHIRFFTTRNPGASQGDELCCLGRIDVALAVNYAGRRLRRGLRLGGHVRVSSLPTEARAAG